MIISFARSVMLKEFLQRIVMYVKRILNILLIGGIIGIYLFCLFTTYVFQLSAEGKDFHGITCFMAGSTSMEPKYYKYSLIYNIKKDTYNYPDVITYYASTTNEPLRGDYVHTHGIAVPSVDGRTFLTKGDNNQEDDMSNMGSIPKEKVIGSVFFQIPIGESKVLSDMLESNMSFKSIIIFTLVIITLFFVIILLIGGTRMKKMVKNNEFDTIKFQSRLDRVLLLIKLGLYRGKKDKDSIKLQKQEAKDAKLLAKAEKKKNDTEKKKSMAAEKKENKLRKIEQKQNLQLEKKEKERNIKQEIRAKELEYMKKNETKKKLEKQLEEYLQKKQYEDATRIIDEISALSA